MPSGFHLPPPTRAHQHPQGLAHLLQLFQSTTLTLAYTISRNQLCHLAPGVTHCQGLTIRGWPSDEWASLTWASWGLGAGACEPVGLGWTREFPGT